MSTEAQWSDLQRDPKAVAALADQGDVRVRRRDGVPLLRVREDSATVTAAGAVSAARALRTAPAHLHAGEESDALVEEFPSVELLPDPDRHQIARTGSRDGRPPARRRHRRAGARRAGP